MKISRRCVLLSPLPAAFAIDPAGAPDALPAPRKTGGMPLLEALAARRSTRSFLSDPLPPQTLSTLLWAACGVNRSDGRRTAPTASNRQQIDVYAVLAAGAFRYDHQAHRLVAVAQKDLRGATGSQDFVAQAPLNLVYVADYSRMGGGEEQKSFYAATDTGFIAQNVYLFCASEGLACVVRGLVDRAGLATALQLSPSQRVTLAQSVGFPA